MSRMYTNPLNVHMEDFGGEGIKRAELVLAGINGGIDKAMKGAITRATEHLRSKSDDRIREHYAISKKNIRDEKNIFLRYSYSPGTVIADIKFTGNKIPLYRYDGTSPKEPKRNMSKITYVRLGLGEDRESKPVNPAVPASGHQLRGTSPYKFRSAFVLEMKSGHKGIFKRTGGIASTGNPEIQEIMGSSVAQMLGSEDVAQKLAEDARKTFNERLDHEIDRLLAGIG